MKKAALIFGIVILLLCAFTLFASAEIVDSGYCGENVTYTLDADGLLTISGAGAMRNYDSYYSRSPFYNNRNIKTVVIAESVTSIGGFAFYGCTGLTSVTIPNSVMSIGSSAFRECTRLTSVTIGNGVTSIGSYAFYKCTGLTTVTVPDSVTSIGDHAYSYCTGLTSVTIPDSVTNIGSYAFDGCTGLTTVTIPNSVTSIGERAFFGCTGLTTVTIPDSVTSIGSSAFYNTTWYNNQPDWLVYAGKVAYRYKGTMPENTVIILKEGTLGIAGSAFSGCTGLTSITIPNSITSIGDSAFKGCTGVTSVTIPGSVTSIGSSAFSGCTGLTTVTIPESVTSIGNYAFSGCTGLTSVTIGNGVTSIGWGAFSGCAGFTSVTIPESVTSIGEAAFSGCTGLASVTIPNGVTSIGSSAFSGCTGLTSVTIPDSVTSIGNSAFYKCSSLTEMVLPFSVQNIYSSAFSGCTALQKLYIYNKTCSIESDAIPATATICGFAGSAVQTYADDNGYLFEPISHTEHAWNAGEITAAATCGANGVKTYTCTLCGETKTETVPALGHAYGAPAYVWSDDNTSVTATAVCANDGTHMITETVKTAAETTPASCTENGKTVYTAAFGNKMFYAQTKEIVLPALGHDYVSHEAKSATCTEAGWGAYQTCSRCDYTTYAEQPALGHAFVDHSKKAPTCTAVGWDAYKTCSRCDYTTYVEKTALGHDYITHGAKTPTCTGIGWNAYKTCSRCSYSNYKALPATGHAYSSWTITTAPTCKEGMMVRICNTCAFVENKTMAPVQGHTYKNVITKATLTKNGKITPTCTVCGTTKTATVIAKASKITISKAKFVYNAKVQKPTLTVKNSAGKAISTKYYTVKWSNASSKAVGKYTVTVTFKGNYSGKKVLTYTIVPKAVTGVKNAASTTKSIKLSWTKATGAKYYEVYGSVDGKTFKKITTVSTNTFNVTKVNGKALAAGKTYWFKVRALDGTKKLIGAYSAALKTGTLTAAPKLTKLTSAKSKTATATWGKVTGAKNYVVYKSTDGKKWTKAGSTTGTSFTLTKLTGGKRIYVKVLAVNAYKANSAFSAVKYVTVKK